MSGLPYEQTLTPTRCYPASKMAVTCAMSK